MKFIKFNGIGFIALTLKFTIRAWTVSTRLFKNPSEKPEKHVGKSDACLATSFRRCEARKIVHSTAFYLE